MAKAWDRNLFMKNLGKAKEEEDKSSGFTDQRFIKFETPDKDKAVYRIRLIPLMKVDSLPWVKVNRHHFKGPQGWFVENCPSTLGHKCPIDEHAGILFNTGDPEDEKKARMFYKKKRYITNILVVKDGRNNGANEGKVFLWEFGQKIYDKLYSALFPGDSGLEQIVFIDPYQGFDLNLICKMVGGFPNYDDSTFVRDATPLAKDDEKIDKILESVYDIQSEFLAEKNFKSYDELEIAFKTKVLNSIGGGQEKQAAPLSRKPAPAAKPTPDQVLTDEESAMLETPAKKAEAKSEPAKAAEPEQVDDFMAELEQELKKK